VEENSIYAALGTVSTIGIAMPETLPYYSQNEDINSSRCYPQHRNHHKPLHYQDGNSITWDKYLQGRNIASLLIVHIFHEQWILTYPNLGYPNTLNAQTPNVIVLLECLSVCKYKTQWASVI